MADTDGGAREAEARRQALVDDLKREGLLPSPRVEAAFRRVPRHLFLPGLAPEDAYRDDAIPTKRVDGVTVSASSQPAIMAIMLGQLDVQPGDRVLEIGTGTGYNAALLAELAGDDGRVVSVDIDAELVHAARHHLAAAGYPRLEVVCADGFHGYAAAAPYDRIVLTVGAWDVAPAWWKQLRPGGLLVLPLGIGAPQKSVAFQREGGGLASRSVRACGFMPLRGILAPPGARVPLGPHGEAWLWRSDSPGAEGAETLFARLTGPLQRLPTGVRVAEQSIWHGLDVWLAAHLPGLATLWMEEAFARRQRLPCLLVGSGGACQAACLVGQAGLALLVRGEEAADGRFALEVYAAGDAAEPAERLVHAVRSWEAAGQPREDALRIRAYPVTAAYHVPSGGVVVRNRWTTLVLEWESTPSPTPRRA